MTGNITFDKLHWGCVEFLQLNSQQAKQIELPQFPTLNAEVPEESFCSLSFVQMPCAAALPHRSDFMYVLSIIMHLKNTVLPCWTRHKFAQTILQSVNL